MDNIRSLMKKSPTPIIMQTLRTVLTLPPAMASSLIDELTTPLSSQRRYIKIIDNHFWRGALIAPDIRFDSDAEAIRRLRKADVVIFEIHGGGFRTGSSTMYMTPFIKWINMLKEKHGLDAVMMSIEYGLAPTNKYPGPVLECLKAYKHLVEDLRIPAWKVIVSGDSAGGALALETLMRFYAPGLTEDIDAPRTKTDIQIPAGLLLSSPLVTIETDSWSWKNLEKHDMVTQHLAKLILKEYLDYPNVDPESLPILRMSKIYRGFDRFCPKNALVFVGDKEVMRDDIVNLANKVEKDGSIKVRVCKEKYAHDWFLIREIVKQKDKYVLDQYDEVFVDFAANAVAEAAEKVTSTQKGTVLHVDLPNATAIEHIALDEHHQLSASPTKPGVIVP
ncbi:Alpha/Beta hydrolase protein [Fennellomyces sp. T-0311]|nr:Alpha/Beta hydrolase protein [Fennellomyces sp. T-0311]